MDKPSGNLRERLKELEAENAELRSELEEARGRVERDQARIIRLNSALFTQQKNLDHSWKTRKLEWFMEQARRDFNLLLASRRWLLGDGLVSVFKGDLFGKSEPGALTHARRLFRDYDSWKKRFSSSLADPAPEGGDGIGMLMEKLEQSITGLSTSRRYRLGNALVRFPGWILLRPKPRLAMDHMLEILHGYHSRVNKEQPVPPDIVEKWIEELESVFESFLSSARWRVGNRLVGIIDLALLRRRELPVIIHIRNLFREYEIGLYPVRDLDLKRLDYREDSPAVNRFRED